MRIIVIDTDNTFTSPFNARCKTAGISCQIFSTISEAISELKKDPNSIDLVLIAKELADGQDGLNAAEAIRNDVTISDVPYILMSSTWGKTDFAKHQKGPAGANAYYNKKNSPAELDST